jgi:hypothetical protein
MNTWHLDDALAERYADGRVTQVLAASVEQHLIGCADCRSRLHVEPARLDAVWAEIREQVQSPRPGPVERSLRAVGLDAPSARLVALTPSLRGSWLGGVLLVLMLALLAAHSSPHGSSAFTILAPVLPLAGVAFAFGPIADRSHEMTVAAPYSMARLLAVRTAFVVATSLVPATAAALFMPGSHWLAVAWLLPALAMTATTIALAPRVPVHRTAFALAAGWTALHFSRIVVMRHELTASAAATLQLVSCAVLVAAGAAILANRHQISEQLRRTS